MRYGKSASQHLLDPYVEVVPENCICLIPLQDLCTVDKAVIGWLAGLPSFYIVPLRWPFFVQTKNISGTKAEHDY